MNTISPPGNSIQNTTLLTTAETGALHKKIQANTIGIIAASIFLTALGAIAYAVSGEWVFAAFFGLADIGICVWLAVLRTRLKRDLHIGTKNIISGIIEKKDYYSSSNSRNLTYYFYIGGRKFGVSDDQYNAFKEGEKIALHVAADSDTVFSVQSFDKARTIIDRDVLKSADFPPEDSIPEIAKYSEKFLPLTEEEIHNLKKRRTRTALTMVVFSVVWYAVLYFITSQAHDIGFKIFGLVFACFPVLMLGGMMWSATRDIQFGQKKIIRGRIDQKKEQTSRGTENSSSTTYYYFYMSGKEISVNAALYADFQTGDIVEIEMMPKSSDIIKAREIQSNTERSDEPKPVFKSDREAKKAVLNGTQIYDSAPLSMEEENLLKSLRNRRTFKTVFWSGVIGFIGFWILFMVFALALILLHDSEIPFLKPLSQIGPFVYWGLMAFVILMGLRTVFKRVSPLFKDVSGGRKNIIKTIITDKLRSNVKLLNKTWKVTSSRGNYHYAIIDGVYREVTPEQFEIITPGAPVKLHVAPHSGTLLKVEGI